MISISHRRIERDMQNAIKRSIAIAAAIIAMYYPVSIQAQNEPKPGSKMTLTIDGVGFTFCYIPAGSFMMGSPESETGRGEGEKPHKVTITKPFYMMENEVTQEQFQAVASASKTWISDDKFAKNSHFKGDKRPVENIEFLEHRAKTLWDRMAEVSKEKFRLPTEAEWEYACRAGTTTPFHYGKDMDWTMANIDGHEPYGSGVEGRLRNETMEVKQFKPNAWGLYDMHGNVSEVCVDYIAAGVDLYRDGVTDPGAIDPDVVALTSWQTAAYVATPGAVAPVVIDPQKKAKEGMEMISHLGSQPGSMEVNSGNVIVGRMIIRGGNYSVCASECRSAAKVLDHRKNVGADYIGFRLVLIP